MSMIEGPILVPVTARRKSCSADRKGTFCPTLSDFLSSFFIVGGFQSASFISDSPFIKFDKIIVLGVPQKLDRNVDAASELKSGSENKKGKFVPISAATSTCSTTAGINFARRFSFTIAPEREGIVALAAFCTANIISAYSSVIIPRFSGTRRRRCSRFIHIIRLSSTTAPPFCTLPKENSLTSSLRLNISFVVFGFHPSKDTKLITASGRKPRST
mmetsp:Transcript_45675/g.118032  ORF Transcript_45675/g.118032 Transcript_45675/m.118032 type:complete len:216 (-) Transcript_45675:1134-1781(-)